MSGDLVVDSLPCFVSHAFLLLLHAHTAPHCSALALRSCTLDPQLHLLLGGGGGGGGVVAEPSFSFSPKTRHTHALETDRETHTQRERNRERERIDTNT